MDLRTSESYKNVYNRNTTNQSEIHNTKEFQDTSVPKYKFTSKQSHQKFETCKNYDRGDSELNTTTTAAGPPKNSLVHRYPEHPNAGEYLNRVNHTNSTYQYESNQESQAAQQETMGTRTLQYTPDMIKDQELLVSSMSQQGIPEVLIRRQFNRLLEEQAKQIQFDASRSIDNKSVNDCEKKRPQQHNVSRMDNCVPVERKGHCNCIPPEQSKSNPQFRTNTYQDQQQQQHQHQQQHQQHQQHQHQQQHQQQQEEQYQQEEQHQHQQSSDSSISNARLQKVEPVSLLKLRMKREALDSERRNNGLQEAAVAYEILKKCKPVENKFESSSEKREEIQVKLNGTQDRKDMEALCMHQNLQERFGTQQKRTSSNGLENSRDPNNPRPSIRSQCVKCPSDTQYFTSYPRQKNQMYYSQQQNNNYERDTRHETHCQMMNNDTSDNSRVVQEQPQPPQQQSTNDTRTRDETQPQRMCYNNMTFWPEFQEPKIIGGLTYLARKPHCIPKIPGFMCEQLQSQ